jgi:hypothetical protein
MNYWVSNIEPVAPPGYKLTRIIFRCVEQPSNNEPVHDLCIDIPLRNDEEPFIEHSLLGCEGKPANARERWPLVVEPGSGVDFGPNGAPGHDRYGQLTTENNRIRNGSRVFIDYSGTVRAYRATHISPRIT